MNLEPGTDWSLSLATFIIHHCDMLMNVNQSPQPEIIILSFSATFLKEYGAGSEALYETYVYHNISFIVFFYNVNSSLFYSQLTRSLCLPKPNMQWLSVEENI
jgi:hypothetical protein